MNKNMTTTIDIPLGTSVLNITQESGRAVIEFVPKFKGSRVVIEFAPKFKEGDFVYEDGRIIIVEKDPSFYKAIIYPSLYTKVYYDGKYGPPFSSPSFRFATEEEKQLLLDALEKDGKKWNPTKLCIEDIPQRKFKPGDRVKLKEEMLYKIEEYPFFVAEMEVFIDKVLTVKNYSSLGYIYMNEAERWSFAEDWLEPYSNAPIVGELAIFWDNCKYHSKIGIYKGRDFRYINHDDSRWFNAVKFESKEQFLEHIKK